MFLGTHTPKLDEKGRIFLPAKLRDGLADGLVVTRGQDRCLAIWPLADFVEQVRREASAAPLTRKAIDEVRATLDEAARQIRDSLKP